MLTDNELRQFGGDTLGAAFGDLLGYVLAAGVAWLLFYVLFKAQFRRRRIAQREPTAYQISREILYSLRTLAIFGLVTGAIIYAAYLGWTKLYLRIDTYGWGWFVLSVAVMVVVHDAYFYWTHRLMHHRWLFRWVHKAHHRSTSPTPWAAYSFSIPEAFVQAGIGPLIVFTMPVHPGAFTLFMTWQIVFNVLGHCGVEIFPSGFLRSPVRLVLNSVTHHELHHEKFRANFGLYFNVWDRLMGTNHADYERRFALVTGGDNTDKADRQSLAEAEGVCHDGAVDASVAVTRAQSSSMLGEPVASCPHSVAGGGRI